MRNEEGYVRCTWHIPSSFLIQHSPFNIPLIPLFILPRSPSTSAPHHAVQNHQEGLLLLGLRLLDDGDGLADAEALVQLVGGVRGGDDDLPGREALLPRVLDELLA